MVVSRRRLVKSEEIPVRVRSSVSIRGLTRDAPSCWILEGDLADPYSMEEENTRLGAHEELHHKRS